MSLIINSLIKIKEMRYQPKSGNLEDIQITNYLYHLLKFVFSRQPNEKTLKEITE